MARPLEFSEAEALDSAIECFRQRGYHATSVRDLETRMGISTASLYNSFGDKHALFVAALERYIDRSVRPLLRRLEELHAPKQVIPAFFKEAIMRSVSDRSRGGCLLINSALEIGSRDPKLGPKLARYIGEIEDFFYRTIRAGQANGSIAGSLNAKDAARLMLGVLLGIRVLARSNPDQAVLEGMVRPALGLLGCST
jgi:TetR/AcrR family transcriptional repressor of nem operon